jgi:DNA polymerase III subunit gamma/tau
VLRLGLKPSFFSSDFYSFITFFTLSFSLYPLSFTQMSYQVIARKWRPQAFEEVTGQEHITQTLRNALEFDRLHHAYIFSGARGVGKTTTARLLAKALNCHKTDKPTPSPCPAGAEDACPSCIEIGESRSIDVFEFDAASHTGVDDIRDIILSSIDVAPARDRNKIFIIDEVHMLSNASFNALLKTVEEPPPNVVFIMATTLLNKVPDTIRSRCQEFEFRTISVKKIFERLRLIADAEKIDVADDALRVIARSGEGSMRDAQSNFDQVISFSSGAITIEDVTRALGMASVEMIVGTLNAIVEKRPADILRTVEELVSRGQDLRNFCRDLLAAIRDLTVAKVSEEPGELLENSVLDADQITGLAKHLEASDLIRMFNLLALTESSLKDTTQPRFALELGLVKLTEIRKLRPIDEILERLATLEAGGKQPIPAAPDRQTEAKAASAPQEKKTFERPAIAAAAPPEPETLPASSHQSGPEPPDEPPFEPSEPEDPGFYAEPKSVPPAMDLSFLATTPIKLVPLTSEDLEHIDDPKLDDAYEARLLQEGDDLLPLRSAAERIRQLFAESEDRPFAAAASAASALSSAGTKRREFQIPQLDEIEEDIELPVLSGSPTEDELRSYAEAHPAVRKLKRMFRAEVVKVEQA